MSEASNKSEKSQINTKVEEDSLKKRKQFLADESEEEEEEGVSKERSDDPSEDDSGSGEINYAIVKKIGLSIKSYKLFQRT